MRAQIEPYTRTKGQSLAVEKVKPPSYPTAVFGGDIKPFDTKPDTHFSPPPLPPLTPTLGSRPTHGAVADGRHLAESLQHLSNHDPGLAEAASQPPTLALQSPPS